jgi:heptosyltransferase II
MTRLGIVIFGGIGNAVISLETICYLKKKNVTPFIFVLSKVNYSIYRSLLPDANMILFEKKDSLKSYLDIFRIIKSKKLDAVLFNHATESRAFFLLAFLLRIKKRAGLIRNQNIFAKYLLNEKHTLDLYLNVHLQELKLIEDLFKVKIENDKYSDSLLSNNIIKQDQLNELEIFENYIIIAPGGSKENTSGRGMVTKKWPLEYYTELIEELLKNDKSIVLIFGPDDKHEYKYFRNLEKIENVKIVFMAPIDIVIEIIRKTSCFIGNDSGLFHIADLFNKPHYVFFGPSNYRNYGPISESGILFRNNLKCSPCDYMNKKCPYNVECLIDLTPSEIIPQIISAVHNNK